MGCGSSQYAKDAHEDFNRFVVDESGSIGSGSYGTVYKAYSRDEHRIYAAKRVAIGPKCTSTDLVREVDVLKSLRGHPNIVMVVDVVDHYENRKPTGDMLIMMDWMTEGSIASLIHATKFRLHEGIIRRHLRGMVNGLAVLHEAPILHRDLKPANVLVSGDGEACLSDFGTAHVLANKDDERGSSSSVPNGEDHSAEKVMVADRIVGTPQYLAPECVSTMEYSPASDIWALGCTVLEMATAQRPWSHLRKSSSFHTR